MIPKAGLAGIVVAVLAVITTAATAGVSPNNPRKPNYVTTAACAACHKTEHAAWIGSHHDWALRAATPESVLGDFDDAELTHFGVTSRFTRRGGGYFVETEGPDGALAEFEVRYAVGVAPLQQYLVALDGGRLQALGLAWDVPGERWFHLYPDRAIAPKDPLHWTGRLQNWNSQCAECHSTDFVKGYDPETRRFASTWRDMNVGCEACHGPGEAHLTWAKAPDDYQAGNFAGAGPRGLSVAFAAGNPGAEIEVCAACHARRQSLTPRSRVAGQPFLDAFSPALLRPELYHADGQILDEVYVYGSFLQSRMHAKGVRCSDCHQPHGLGLKAEGNALCVQCHGPVGNPRFTSLKPGIFDAPSHHFHQPGEAGANCVDCHMPAKTYMVVDPRRDHSFRVPRPDLSADLGTPNACTGCHAGRSDDWAATAVARWYGPGRRREPHFGSALHAARVGAADAEASLVSLIVDRAQPGIARATALSLLPRYAGRESIRAYQAGLRDPDPLVRAAALRALSPFPPDQRLAAAEYLLTDPVGLVRIEAARTLASVPPRLMSAQQKTAFARAAEAFVGAQMATAEWPESQFNLGAFHADGGRVPEAGAAYREALRLDPSFVPAYMNMAELARLQGDEGGAEAILRDAIARQPDSAAAFHALGLSLVRQGRRKAAVVPLRKSVAIEPGNARYSYVLGVALNAVGETRHALMVLERAHERHPGHRDLLTALIAFNRDIGALKRAHYFAEILVETYPGDRAARQLLEEIKRAGS